MIKITAKELDIEITQDAINQIFLIKENDYTLEDDDYFRLKIDGKGCNGFEYALGYTKKDKDDLEIELTLNDKALRLIIDPFTAYYCKKGCIDYVLNHEKEVEGFSFTNIAEKNYKGKFFKDESMAPRMS